MARPHSTYLLSQAFSLTRWSPLKTEDHTLKVHFTCRCVIALTPLKTEGLLNQRPSMVEPAIIWVWMSYELRVKSCGCELILRVEKCELQVSRCKLQNAS